MMKNNFDLFTIVERIKLIYDRLDYYRNRATFTDGGCYNRFTGRSTGTYGNTKIKRKRGMKAVIRFVLELHRVQTCLRNY